jgi:RHS repeat-associated protein
MTKFYFPQGFEVVSGMGSKAVKTNYYYTKDHLGSVREILIANGSVAAAYGYDPFGNRTQLTGTMVSDIGFTGFYTESVSGLSLALYRQYDPRLGRWISRDPLGERGGVNLYDYVRNNPTRWIDPLGEDIWVGSRGLHQNINVGDPNGNYSSYSFGIDTDNYSNFSALNPFNESGEVYSDYPPNAIDDSMYLNTTPQEDAEANSILSAMANSGEHIPYRLSNSTCRSFSQSMFNAFQQMQMQTYPSGPAYPLPSGMAPSYPIVN